MPIYTNGSTFPIHKFNLLNNNRLFSIEDINNLIYYPNHFDSYGDFVDVINNIEIRNQHLLETILPYSFRRVFENDKKVISRKDITSQSIMDINQFVVITNLKLNLNDIENELEYLSDIGISINRKRFLNDIITFTYKYLFIKLSKVIYCHSIGKFNEVMDFKSHYDQYCKYQSDLETSNYTKINYYSKVNYVNAYYESFQTNDINLIQDILSEILQYDDEKKIVKILNDIIENNIPLDPSLSSKKKNKFLLPFFKLITCNFFYRELLGYELSDSELINRFKKFRLKMVNI
ncbi:hypothetical protein [Flavobacterium phycosphaerae]|uniref:hypothetical protein n=1 Tax=Flavobacterium phycosphaerae TaxID=2697515 RepID=UPI00138AD76D|nr:hypothetical protein [Flavobacterium phycosphaerae]